MNCIDDCCVDVEKRKEDIQRLSLPLNIELVDFWYMLEITMMI